MHSILHSQYFGLYEGTFKNLYEMCDENTMYEFLNFFFHQNKFFSSLHSFKEFFEVASLMHFHLLGI